MAAIDRLQRLSDTVWELPVTFKEDMRVPARLYATEPLIRSMDDAVYDQISNVATLPGITRQVVFQISI
jgi:tRNA-splicing ligase RtcB